MTVVGYLSDFSLPDLFRLLEQAHKTGILTISDTQSRHSVWFYEGRVVAYTQEASACFLSLSDRLGQLCDLGRHTLERMQRLRPDSRPLGHWLQEQGVIQESQLQQLFRERVVQPTSNLFAMGEGQFCFRPQSGLPLVEMTGLSIPATALIMAGFRHLEDWTALEADLPSAQMRLSRLGQVHPARLSPLELQILEQADAQQSLEAIALQLEQPLIEIQKVAFRFLRAGFVDCLKPSDVNSDANHGTLASREERPSWTEWPQRVGTPLSRSVQSFFQRDYFPS